MSVLWEGKNGTFSTPNSCLLAWLSNMASPLSQLASLPTCHSTKNKLYPRSRPFRRYLRFLTSPSVILIINKTARRAVLFIIRVPEGLVKKRKKRRNGRDLGYNLFFGTFVCLEESYLLDDRHSERMKGFLLAELCGCCLE